MQYLLGLEEVDMIFQYMKTKPKSVYDMRESLPPLRRIVPGPWRAKAGDAILDFARADLEKHIQSSVR
jgi:hypothetical protein